MPHLVPSALHVCLAALLLIGCSKTAPASITQPDTNRVVSLDYCADQYVLALVDRDRIAGLSIDAEKPFSYLRNEAANITKVRPTREDVLTLKPDIVVRSYGGDPDTLHAFERLGMKTVQLQYIESLSAMGDELRRVGALLDAEIRAEQLASDFDVRLAALAMPDTEMLSGAPQALYLAAGGVTAGKGTLIGELINRAGYRNFEHRNGWQSIPLERLTFDIPDLIIEAGFTGQHTLWSASRHKVVRKASVTSQVLSLDGALTACSAWFIADALETIASARTDPS